MSAEQDKFVREEFRPLAEEIGILYLRIKDGVNQYVAQGLSIPNDSTEYDDRSSQGIAPRTGAEINTLISHLNGLKSYLETSTNLQEVLKFRVRVPNIS